MRSPIARCEARFFSPPNQGRRNAIPKKKYHCWFQITKQTESQARTAPHVWVAETAPEKTKYVLKLTFPFSTLRLVWEEHSTNIVMVTTENVDSTFNDIKSAWPAH